MFSLQGKTALVTGGAQGIGLAIARNYVEAGAEVIIADRQDGEAIAREIGAKFVSLDVTDEGAVSDALDRVEADLGKLDILVLNAGIAHEHVIEELPSEVHQRVMDVNVNGVFYGLKYGPRHMNDGSSIIVTSSTAAMFGTPESSSYCASKAAASSLMKCAAIELGPRGIRVNAVCPGGMQTSIALPSVIFEVLTPAARIGVPEEDLVGIYNLLASDAGAYINGQEIAVDGGLTAGLTLQVFDKIFS
jgi:3alpha(or 20beta)-hydroxysteroid dehydrogenase